MSSLRTWAWGLLGSLLLTSPAMASPMVIGWWRMETDTDGTAAFSIPNEVTGSPLTGANASLQPLVGGGTTFFPALPQPPSPSNASGLNGNADINGSVAHYSALDASSITVEFFARTNEGDARFLLRQSGTTGLRVDQPNALRVQYSTASGQVSINTGVDFFDANWDHFAFTYDEVLGLGQVYVNGALVGSNNGPDGEALTWPALSALLVGNGQDGGSGLSGNSEPFFDELRIVNQALSPTQFLTGSLSLEIPEPSSLAVWCLLGAGAAAVWTIRVGKRNRVSA